MLPSRPHSHELMPSADTISSTADQRSVPDAENDDASTCRLPVDAPLIQNTRKRVCWVEPHTADPEQASRYADPAVASPAGMVYTDDRAPKVAAVTVVTVVSARP